MTAAAFAPAWCGPAEADGTRRLRGASCVAARREADGLWRAALLVGPSGAGKSALALGVAALGGRIVADDTVRLRPTPSGLDALACDRTPGAVEARGLGLLRLSALACAPLAMIVSLDPRSQPPQDAARLPPWRETALLGRPSLFIATSAAYTSAAGLYAALALGDLIDPDAPMTRPSKG